MANKSRISPAALLAIAGLSGEVNAAEAQTVYPAGTLPTFTGPEAMFTGKVDVQMAFPGDNTPYSGAFVTFQPSARTAWHDHPAGQHMVVTKGTAITATRDGQVVSFSEGEAVWCPEGVDHWHGATPHAAMTHFVVTGSKDNSAVNWKDKVSDAQYQAALDALKGTAPEIKRLTIREQQLVVAVAFAAADDLGSLRAVFDESLEAGVTINDLSESMVHLYPYGGFPKSLNGLGTLMAVVNERKAAGKKDVEGAEPQPLPAPDQAEALGKKVQTELVGHPVSGPLFDFEPVANTFLQKHLFGDVFARGLFSNQEREILTVAILASMPGAAPQLNSHIGMSLHTGVSPETLQELASLLEFRVSRATGLRVSSALTAVQN
ncbi:cupin domain-containing carboxymuconolactone decarboxylase family protein [Parathalassolituus penaei]|uniref:Carboxymuconolactone decarboxylase family protein n=1 Tax=Parathalassolituus penaei TaxID=2997323 RepID=A0A9X3ED29_9GAMM|nr:carboxymuconolactone decarboxylase family protein [Parathalassolituus penaei]MCY0964594.1 carboxymuconolactone decarboxylase family protein [Parathalassolituus penaei]